MKTLKTVLTAAVILSLIVIVAVSWHSVQEIHYLKTFYPDHFTVAEVFFAACVELVKVHIIVLPLIVVIGMSLYFFMRLGKGD